MFGIEFANQIVGLPQPQFTERDGLKRRFGTELRKGVRGVPIRVSQYVVLGMPNARPET
ncbi:MAG: hypothetical protein AAGA32_21090 [Pseudomonadota bacterium]